MKFKINERVPLYTVVATCLTVSTAFIDPINLPKLMVLVLGTSVIVFSWFFEKSFPSRFENKLPILIIVLFISGLTLAALASNQNVMRTLLGTNGRNNGFISYLCLAIILFEGINFGKRGQSDRVIRMFALVGLLLGLYGFMQMNRADFFHFVYGGNPIILTLGNEDFSSLILTLTVLASIYAMLETNKDLWKIAYGISAIFQIWIIININTAQSKLALTSGLLIFTIIFNLLKKRIDTKTKLLISFPVLLVIFSVVIGFFGRGPLSTINSNLRNFRSRVYHWQEAWYMFKARPITGIGLDSYGQYQPYYKVMTAEGTPDTYSDNAHNVFMQLLATGGLVLILTFLLLVFFIFYRHIISLKSRNLPRVLVAFESSFLIIFLAHLIVGIDNLGLAVCFWFFSGLIIGGSYIKEPLKNINSQNKEMVKDKFHRVLPKAFKYTLAPLIFISMMVTMSEVRAHLAISQILITNGQIKVNANDTERIFKTAMMSQNPDLRLVSIRTLYTLGSFEKGFEIASDSIKRFPRDLPTLDAIAIYYEQIKEYKKALRVRQKMVYLDPLSDVLKQKLSDVEKLIQ